MKLESRPSAEAVVLPFAFACLLSFAWPVSAQAQVNTRATELEFSGRLQFQLQTSSCGETPAAGDPLATRCAFRAPGLDMFMRRARLAVTATIDDRLTFRFEPDVSDVDELSLADAWGRYAFGPGAAVKAGHFKRPFDGFHLTSSSHLPFERAVGVPGVSRGTVPSYSGLTKGSDLSDRDIGLMLEGAPRDGRVAWWLGVFTGRSGSKESDTNTEKQLIGRTRVKVADVGEDRSPLMLAGALALTDAPYVATDGRTESEYFTNFELFAELGAYDEPGLLLQLGFVGGDNPDRDPDGTAIDLAAGDVFARLLTWQGVGAYRVATDGADWLEAVALFARVSYGDPSEADDDEVWAFTPGVALYFHARNRLALTWDVARFPGGETEHSVIAQMQFHF